MAGKVAAIPPRVSVVVNENKRYDRANPHTHLRLLGDAPDAPYPRVMFGALCASFRGKTTSATAFALSKIMISAPEGTPPWTQTAARVEALLPVGSCDRFLDPKTLMEAVDAERPGKINTLLAYVTFTFPTDRLHDQGESFANLFAKFS